MIDINDVYLYDEMEVGELENVILDVFFSQMVQGMGEHGAMKITNSNNCVQRTQNRCL